MSSENALEVSNLGKCYRVFTKPHHRLKQAVVGTRKDYFREVWALKGVSFQLRKGETLGVIGRNGSGKSTLLQLICGTLRPTTGHVKTHGRVGALLELGSGFNPEFTGIENIYLNGALLGLKEKEVDERLDDILSFADIGEFALQCVKTYSSGMALRLAFAVQAMVNPDILIVDEALAVGDERFQKKCYAHLEKLRDGGTSILLVTHSCPTIVQQCNQALLLQGGQARLMGTPKVVTTVYQRMTADPQNQWKEEYLELAKRLEADHQQSRQSDTSGLTENNFLVPETTVVFPDRGARIEDVACTTLTGSLQSLINQDEIIELRLRVFVEEEITDARIGCVITDLTGSRVSGQLWPSGAPHYAPVLERGEHSFSFRFKASLKSGDYYVTTTIKQQGATNYIHRIADATMFRVIENAEHRVVGLVNLFEGQAQHSKQD